MHDADAHLMEPPDLIADHAEDGATVNDLWMAGRAEFAADLVAQLRAWRTDPDHQRIAEEGLLTRRGWYGYGAFEPQDRSRALDLLGFSSQLVFATHARAVVFDQPGHPPTASFDPSTQYATARAYNRAVTEFCAADARLLPVALVPLEDPVAAFRLVVEAVAAGAAAIEIAAWPAGGTSPTHAANDALWTVLEDADVPVVFHIGSGGDAPPVAYGVDGRPERHDPLGNYERLRPLRVIATPGPVAVAVASLVFDGVLERHPGLRVGVMELGASWVPGWLRQLDLAAELDAGMQGADEPWGPGALPLRPSDYVRRQVRFTPFPDEDLGWLIEQTGDELYLFSSDYPHVEGGENPMARFDAALERFGPRTADRFYHQNFEAMLGRRALDLPRAVVGSTAAE